MPRSDAPPTRVMPAKGGEDVANVKQTLQAVVIADSFANAFKPLTVRGPKVLLPIAHAPALEYVLEWLAYPEFTTAR